LNSPPLLAIIRKIKSLTSLKKDPSKMFPKINEIFRKKEIMEVATLKIKPILNEVRLEIDKLEKYKNENLLIDTRYRTN